MSTDSDIAQAAAQAAAASSTTAGSAASAAALALAQTRTLSEIDTADDAVALLVRPGPEGSQTKSALASSISSAGVVRDSVEALVGQQADTPGTPLRQAITDYVTVNDLGTSDGQTKALLESKVSLSYAALVAFAERGKVIRVDDRGAKGDGTTDDTAAITAAITAAGANAALAFTPGKTYLLRAGLRPLAGQFWFGYGAILKRANGVTTTTATPIAIGDGSLANGAKVITVASTAGFTVGMTVTVTTSANHYDGCYEAHTVVAVDPTAKTLSLGVAFTKAFPTGGTVVSHHALITTPLAIGGSEAVGVKGGDNGTVDYVDGVHIRGLTLDGNRANNTAYTAWQTNASISLYSDGGSIADCRIVNSQADGIICGGQGMSVRDNIILRSGGNSIHLSGMGGGRIVNNYCKDATLAITGTDANTGPGHAEGLMTWSNSIYDTVVEGNYFENGRSIFGALGSADNSDNIIANNTCIGATLYAVEFRDIIGTAADPHLGGLVMTGNRFRDCAPVTIENNQNTLAAGTYGTGPDRITLTGNEFWNTKVILHRAKNVAVTGNRFRWTATLATTILLYLDRVTSVAVTGNVFVGGNYGVYSQGRAPVSGATKWMAGHGIQVTGNVFHNQYDAAIQIPTVAGFAWRTFAISDNTIVTDTAQAAGYAAINAANGVTVKGNTIDTANGRGVVCGGDSTTAPVGVPGSIVTDNLIRTVSDSVRIFGGTRNNVVQRNQIVTAISGATNPDNTVSDNVTLIA